MRTKLLILCILLAVTAAGAAWFWKSDKTKSATTIQQTASASRSKVRATLEATGIIKPEVGAIVKTGTRATGLIKRMYVRVGDTVKQGDLIAEIDDREQQASLAETQASVKKATAELDRIETVYPLQINEAEAQLKAAQAELEYLKLTLQRKEKLVGQKLDSQNSLDDAIQQHEVAQNTLKARKATVERLKKEYKVERVKAREALAQAEAALDSIKVRITYTTIYAPIDGVVSQVAAQEGETVVAGLEVANLITILDPNRLEMWIYVDETDVGQVVSGMAVEFRVDAYPQRTFHGTVDQIYPQPEIRDNIVYYQALVRLAPETALALRPEMTTQCTIIVQEKENVLAIPNEALKWVNGEQFVFRKNSDGSIEKLQPELGLAGQQQTEIISGLSEGDTVATRISLPAGGKKAAR